MKKTITTLAVALSAMILFTGCIGLQIGGGERTGEKKPTLGQQLIDLQKAKDSGAITSAEYEAQKAILLEQK
jgi:hypothetical protein